MNFPQTVILVVEGPDDKIALHEIVDPKTCDIKFLEGKRKVFECLEMVHEQRRENVVGLVDIDYEKILRWNGLPPPGYIQKYLFFTDSHDMNTTVAASGAFMKLLKSCNPGDEFKEDKYQSIREHAVAITQQIGLVRCLNSDQTYPERFNFREDVRLDPPHIHQYIDIPTKKLRLEILLTSVKRDLSPEKRRELCIFITQRYSEELKARYPKEDLAWQLCQGHDLFSVLYTLLQDDGCLGLDFKEFSTALFNHFGIEDLKESGKNLYQKIKGWENKAAKNGKLYRILKIPN